MRMSHRRALLGGAKKTYALTYSGTKTEDMIPRADGHVWRRLALTGSGTLTVSGDVVADICVVGGGCYGLAGRKGGGSGTLKNYPGISLTTGAVVIGAERGTTSYAGKTAAGATTGNGQSGGGVPSGGTAGTGSYASCYPFSDSARFPLLCGAGGAGGYYSWYQDEYGNIEGGTGTGGNGGTNGSNGSVGTTSGTAAGTGGAGGGGNGGAGSSSSTSRNGKNGTIYGAGGGGAGSYSSQGNGGGGSVGSGYQGICYILIDTEAYQAI